MVDDNEHSANNNTVTTTAINIGAFYCALSNRRLGHRWGRKRGCLDRKVQKNDDALSCEVGAMSFIVQMSKVRPGGVR